MADFHSLAVIFAIAALVGSAVVGILLWKGLITKEMAGGLVAGLVVAAAAALGWSKVTGGGGAGQNPPPQPDPVPEPPEPRTPDVAIDQVVRNTEVKVREIEEDEQITDEVKRLLELTNRDVGD